LSPTGDFFEDVVDFDGPDERFWIGAVIVQVVLDSGFKIGDAFKPDGNLSLETQH
jgi:hypothetical protein